MKYIPIQIPPVINRMKRRPSNWRRWTNEQKFVYESVYYECLIQNLVFKEQISTARASAIALSAAVEIGSYISDGKRRDIQS